MWFSRKIIGAIALIHTQCYLRFFFKSLGTMSKIISPLKIDGIANISLGDKVIIEKGAWLAALPLTGKKSDLIIHDNCVIGHYSHIYATNRVVIEKYVLIADKVYISDNIHQFEDVNFPIIQQPIKQLSNVRIGEGSWIGENVCIIGASIGKHCVIGANAVVNKDIPDFSVAVGVPARIIKKYCFKKKMWLKVEDISR